MTDCLLAKSDATEENTNDSGAPNEQEDLEQTGEDTEKLDKPTDNGDTDADMVPEAFRYQAVCRTIEVILSQAEVLPKLYQKLWKKLFSGILVKLAQHELANYTVQKLLSTCPDKEQVRLHSFSSFLRLSNKVRSVFSMISV